MERAFWLREPGHGELRPVELPVPGPDEVLVRTRYSAVSRGTESLVFRGGVPESQHDVMRAPFQEGDFPAPVKYGYLNVGTVESGPSDLVGRTVFCLYPHQTRYVVPAAAVTVVPESVPAARAVLAGHGRDRAQRGVGRVTAGRGPDRGDRGRDGRCRRRPRSWPGFPPPGCSSSTSTPRGPASRRRWGWTSPCPMRHEDGCDLVVHASASEQGLVRALELLRAGRGLCRAQLVRGPKGQRAAGGVVPLPAADYP